MADDSNENSGFKVVDRRSFNSEGSRRDDEKPEPKSTDTRPESARRIEIPRESKVIQPPSERVRSHEHEGELDLGGFDDGESSSEPTGFETLVSYLSTTAMFQLGLMPGPGGERIPADMTNAQQTIDLLEVLQEKTSGNLTSNESRLLDTVLYELRMTFVELQKRLARKG